MAGRRRKIMSVDLFEALVAGTIGGGGGSDKYVAGANITITDNGDGTKTIAASGEVSSEDTVARESIANHKADKSNPHEVTKAQVGLGNVDNTADLDKPVSTATQIALGAKANSADVYTKAEVDALVDGVDVPTSLAELSGDSTHRTVSDAEKAAWNAKADAADIPTVPIKGIEKNGTALTPDASGVVNITVPTVDGLQSEITSTNKLDADLVDDSTSTNKFVSNAEKSAWNGKQSAITNSNKLSSDLVDDTNNTHKFATAAQLAQIATNASDISDIQTIIGNINSVLEGVL